GPNGAGKTTLLKVLATLVRPSQGRAWVDEIDVAARPRAARARLGYVLAEERSFFWRLSVRENLRFFAALQDLHGAAAQDRIDALAALVGLTDVIDRRFSDLSLGQRQRVAIARGIIADPPVLLFDEATRSLDPGRASRLRRVIRQILVERSNKAVLFATHDLQEAEQLADRVVLMVDGQVEAEGPFSALRTQIHRVFAAEARREDEALAEIFPDLAGTVSKQNGGESWP
ncbi:MAG: ABC transporter ATP-binding protein, partial [Myxococcota bacterium]